MAGGSSPGIISERGMLAAPVGVASFAATPVVAEPPQLPASPTAYLAPVRALLAGFRDRLVVASGASTAWRLDRAITTEIDRGTAFLLIPVCLAIGAIIYFNLDREPDLWPLAAGTVCLAAGVAVTRSRPLLNYMAVAILFCLLGTCLAKIETMRAGTKMLGAEISTLLTGRVAAIEHMANGRVRLTIDVMSTARPQLRYAPERIRVSARKLEEGIEAGSMVTGLVRLMPPSGPVRPGSYDFSFESFFDGIGASGFFLRGPTAAATTATGPAVGRFQAAVERFRYRIADRIRARIGGAEGEIAAALVVGVRAGIPADVNNALRRAGIYHIISISGLHMALVAGTIMGLLRFGFALFPDFSSRRPTKKYAAALAILGLAAYLFISGGEVAAQRSFMMLAVMLTAVLFDRAALTMRNLAISAIIVMATLPHEVMGPSFQMSFAATAGMVGAYAGWSDFKRRRPTTAPADKTLIARTLRRLSLATVALAATSLVAGSSTAIYAAWHFQQMTSLGLFTNLTAIPIVSSVVMPFAVLGVLAMPFGLDGPFLDVMGIGLTATIAIARWFSEHSPADVVGLIAPAAVVALTIALLIATIATTWLRAAAIPVAAIGLLLLGEQPHPDMLVSEDARLVALSLGNGAMAMNRARASEFTLDNWKRAFRAESLVAPEKPMAGKTDAKVGSDIVVAAASNPIPPIGPAFTCEGELCLARHPSGAIVAYAANAGAAKPACDLASVIIINDATASHVCTTGGTLIVSKRDLARRGSAAISFLPNGNAPPKADASADSGNIGSLNDGDRAAEMATAMITDVANAARITATIEYAVRQPYRPWHVQRRFSREARGLAPYQRVKPDAPALSRAVKPSPLQ